MAGTTVTTDADGAVISIIESPAVATVSFGRKNGLPNFSNEEFSIFLQVPLTDTSSPEAIEAELDPTVAFLKAYVYKQLGTSATVQPNGVVAGEVPVEKPKAARGGGRPAGAPAAQAAPVTDDERDELWAALAGATVDPSTGYIKTQQGETVYDNRTNKRNPKAPDFKFAQSGKGLWMNTAPTWYVGPGEGISL